MRGVVGEGLRRQNGGGGRSQTNKIRGGGGQWKIMSSLGGSNIKLNSPITTMYSVTSLYVSIQELPYSATGKTVGYRELMQLSFLLFCNKELPVASAFLYFLPKALQSFATLDQDLFRSIKRYFGLSFGPVNDSMRHFG